MDNKLMFSSKRQAWSTPKDFFRKLNKKYKFNLDPCATKEDAVCKRFFTEKEDGLKRSWKGKRVFVNPPFKEISKWVKKAHTQIKLDKDKAELVVIIAASRTDTKWFHNYVYNVSTGKAYKGVKFTFIPGRLTYGSDKYWRWVWRQKKINGKVNKLYGTTKKNPAPFPSIIIEMRNK